MNDKTIEELIKIGENTTGPASTAAFTKVEVRMFGQIINVIKSAQDSIDNVSNKVYDLRQDLIKYNEANEKYTKKLICLTYLIAILTAFMAILTAFTVIPAVKDLIVWIYQIWK